MRNLIATTAILLATVSAFAWPTSGFAKGCLKGAAVGAAAGHVAGHHAVVGAAAGCAIEHHREKKAKQDLEKKGELARQRPNQVPVQPASPDSK